MAESRSSTAARSLRSRSVRAGKKPSDWTPEEMRAFGIPFPELLDPRAGMKSREVAGGTGPESVARALAVAKQRLDEMNA